MMLPKCKGSASAYRPRPTTANMSDTSQGPGGHVTRSLWWLLSCSQMCETQLMTSWLPCVPLARYENLRVVRVPRIPGTFSPPPRVSDPDMHHGTCVTHAGIANLLFSLKSGRRKRS